MLQCDAMTLSALCRELSGTLLGGKISKIMMPSSTEAIFLLYAGGKNRKLLISLHPADFRIHLSEDAAREQAAGAGSFVMLLRKHLGGGTLLGIEAVPYERAAVLDIENRSALSDRLRRKLVIELMGRQSNLILCDGEGIIIAALKTAPIDSGASRLLFPGQRYTPPPCSKIRPDDKAGLLSMLEHYDGGGLTDLFRARVMGIGKCTAKHLALSAGVPEFGALSAAQREKAVSAVTDFDAFIASGQYKPCISVRNGMPDGFYACPYLDGEKGEGGGTTYRDCPTLSHAVAACFVQRDRDKMRTAQKKGAHAALNAATKRAEKKCAQAAAKLSECEGMDTFRRYGTLLTANLYLYKDMRSRPESALLPDYERDGEPVRIPLDVTLSVQQNARKYFKKYNKLKTGLTFSQKQLSEGEATLMYLNSVRAMLDAADEPADIEGIVQELTQAGLMRPVKAPAKKSKTQDKEPPYFRTELEGGAVLCAGKNNLQNDYVTFKKARPDDLWFHVQKAHGSHVVLLLHGAKGGKADDRDILAAARLAAQMSELKDAGKAPVDYCPRKFVKKPSGAPAGFVVYTDYKTVMADIDSSKK